MWKHSRPFTAMRRGGLRMSIGGGGSAGTICSDHIETGERHSRKSSDADHHSAEMEEAAECPFVLDAAAKRLLEICSMVSSA